MSRTPPSFALRSTALALWDWAFPPVCMRCALPLETAREDFLCTRCRDELTPLGGPHCPCASFASGPVDCGFCRRLPAGFATLRAAFPYGGVAGDLIRSLKYRREETAARYLARMTAGALGEHLDRLLHEGRTEAIVPVPMHVTRLFWRHFNQAEAIARHLSPILKIPVEPQALRRARRTPRQARAATPEQRLANVAGAFDCPFPDAVMGRRFLLLDDVVTTGATVSSCARALIDAGAARVDVVAVALAGGVEAFAASEATGAHPA